LQLTYFCYFCLVSCTIAMLKGYGRFLEQPFLRLDRKFAILFIILLFALIFVNQNAFEPLLKVLEVIK